jgi:hypothetical protein
MAWINGETLGVHFVKQTVTTNERAKRALHQPK